MIEINLKYAIVSLQGRTFEIEYEKNEEKEEVLPHFLAVQVDRLAIDAVWLREIVLKHLVDHFNKVEEKLGYQLIEQINPKKK